MYIQRTAEATIKRLSKEFKVVLVTGARQVGKSTLLKHCDSAREYVTLDNLFERESANQNPELFLQAHKPPVIIDEIQYAPNLLSYIKMAVDSSDAKGQYWLTGSQHFHMTKNVSESLAGRVGILNLMGFSISELSNRPKRAPFFPDQEEIEKRRRTSKKYTLTEVFERIFQGSFPALNDASEHTNRDDFYAAYLNTYVTRDIRDLSAVSNELQFMKFITIVAARTGQVLKYSELANAVGISEPTAKKWLSILVSSDLVYLLEPYYLNITKRMTKMPKLYFLDTGLCAYLTKWSSPETLENGAMNGAFFETFVVSEILKSYRHSGKRPFFYWYRDADQKEIDLLMERDGKLHPLETKLTANPNRSMLKNFSVLKNPGYGGLICLMNKDCPLTENVSAVPVGYI